MKGCKEIIVYKDKNLDKTLLTIIFENSVNIDWMQNVKERILYGK